MTTYTHPHTIDDGHGSRMTFERTERDERGEYLVVSSVVRPGSGPPMHVHHRQDESVTVVSGEVAWEGTDGAEHRAGPGETATFAAGVAHRFWNPGQDDLHLTGEIRPPHNIEYFLTQLYDSTRRGGGRPEPFDGAYLTHRYRTEFGLLAVPAPVQRVVFPVVRTLGRLRGKHRRFADAPEPVA